MKVRQFVSLVLFLPFWVNAQTPGMSEEQMQSMMKNMQQMQECFARIDQAALQKLGQKGQEMQTQLQSLCTNGKRDQAQAKAMQFAQVYTNSKEVKVLRECGQQIASFIPDVSSMMKELENSDRHVCDSYKQ